MSSLLLVILIGTVLTNTFVLMHDDEALGGDRQNGSIANAIRIGGATCATLIPSVLLSKWLWLVLSPAPRDALLLVYSLGVVTIAIGLHFIARTRLPRLRRSLASSPVLIVANCLALGTLLLAPLDTASADAMLGYAVALGIGFGVLLTVFVALTARITEYEVPAAFRLAPITLISAGLTALALLGFAGVLQL